MIQTLETTVRGIKAAAEMVGLTVPRLKTVLSLPGAPQPQENLFDTVAIAEFIEQQEEPDGAIPAAAPAAVRYVTIRIPVCEPSGYIADEISFASHIDARLRDAQQLRGLRHVHMGCRESHARFADGRHVDSVTDVVRYLFALIGEASEASE